MIFKKRFAKLSSLMEKGNKNNHFVSYLLNHFRAAIVSLDRLICTPIASLLTIIVIGIALSLPFGLKVLVQNAKILSQNWDHGTQVTLYLKMNISAVEKQALLERLKNDSDIAYIKYISPEEGLTTLQKKLDIQGVLQQLQENPLPAVVVITPKDNAPHAIENLFNAMKQLSAVELVRLDKNWFERLYYLIFLARDVFLALLVLFSVGVIFIVGNTIRLVLQHAGKEITIMKLVGANDVFVRRPFLYVGIYYGVFGAALAWIILFTMTLWLRVPIYNLFMAYGSNFSLQLLDEQGIWSLFGVGALLGWIGARLAMLNR